MHANDHSENGLYGICHGHFNQFGRDPDDFQFRRKASKTLIVVNSEPLYLVDASIYIFRAYYSIPPSFVTTSGEVVNAVYGYTNFLVELLEKRPEHISCAFDESLPILMGFLPLLNILKINLTFQTKDMFYKIYAIDTYEILQIYQYIQ